MEPLETRTITLGSRPSKLARWQTEHVLQLLQAAWPELHCQMITLVTEGDRRLDRPLPEIGGKGVFTAELETALRNGEIDLAVHSLKDLPVENAAGLCIGAISRRADARDVLISAKRLTLEQLPLGAKVGTSSLRRQAQIKAVRPDIEILPLRGNVDTRLRKALNGEYDAIILAAAGLERLELGDNISQYLPFDLMLPAPGQGALAVQCRSAECNPEAGDLLRLLQALHDPITQGCVSAERGFLAGLGGGCSAPVAAYAQPVDGQYRMQGLVASPDGQRVIRVSAEGTDPSELGALLAQMALAQGAGEILA